MRILYCSCHAVLEYDELKMFSEIGAEVFSTGTYMDPQNPAQLYRPPLKLPQRPELIESFRGLDEHELSEAAIKWADIVIVMHDVQWMAKNWERFRGKPIIWRSIGQSIPMIEEIMGHFRSLGVKIVRYSPRESKIPRYAGEDAVIRFCKDPDEFCGWTGKEMRVVTVNQHLPKRGEEDPSYKAYLLATDGLPRKLFGPGNEGVGEDDSGFAPYEQIKQELQDARVYFYVGTTPASYCLNFIEAWMTGIPIVAIGAGLHNKEDIGETYEVHELIESGVSGFVSDDSNSLGYSLRFMLNHWGFAKRVGMKGREEAIRLFGKNGIKNQWEDFIKTL
jgi:hypothetical protein